MLSSLTVKRTFWVVDAALVLCIALLAAKIVITVAAPPPGVSSSIPDVEAANRPSAVKRMKPADYYIAMGERRIFGGAGASGAPGGGKGAANPLDELPATALSLRLLGTAVGTEGMSGAVIENRTSRSVRVYTEGQKVAPMTTLERILAKKVILNRDGNREVLTLAEGQAAPSAPVSQRSRSAAGPLPRTTRTRPGTTVVDRREWVDKNVDDLLGNSKVSPVWRDGRVEGLQVSDVAENEYAKRLGLEEGDVVVSVNGIKIQSVDQAVTLANKLQRAPALRVEILRDGKPVTRTFSLR